MLDEFRVAFVRAREADVSVTPELPWSWLETGWQLMPDATNDVVTWSYGSVDPWHLAYTTNVRPISVEIDGRIVIADGIPTAIDASEIRSKAAEQATRLFGVLNHLP